MRNIFVSKPMNEWISEASLKPIPKMLFSEFWFEGAVSILFADTNVGKSILAVQIGNSISRGVPIKGFKLEAEKQKVLYFDFELSEKQLENRYSEEYENHYQFDENFIRSAINLEADIFLDEEMINEALEEEIVKVGASVVIIDNITYLNQDNEKAKFASFLMKTMKALKNKHNLSILILAHTPKRDFNNPISNNDLQGSKMSINFCDSSFAIGKSYLNEDLRYIKQIKQRMSPILYGTDNICLCRINKGEANSNLQFEFIEYDNEISHLNVSTNLEREEKILKAKQLKGLGKTNIAIGEELGVSEGAIRKWLLK